VSSYRSALDVWRLLTAAALAGLVDETMTIAAEFAKTRYTLGVPISTLQGISHPLANMAFVVQGGRALSRRAAWYLDNEPGERPELAPSAFVFMAEEASKAATMAVHVQGGRCLQRARSVVPSATPSPTVDPTSPPARPVPCAMATPG
jgi:alkylation response protein AidB-like acyl-CoA dehydrogenase